MCAWINAFISSCGYYWYIIYSQHFQQSIDQPGKVANPARGHLNREKTVFLSLLSLARIWSRETGSTVPSRVSSLRLNLVFTHSIPPAFRDAVHIYRQPPSDQNTPATAATCTNGNPDTSGRIFVLKWVSAAETSSPAAYK